MAVDKIIGSGKVHNLQISKIYQKKDATAQQAAPAAGAVAAAAAMPPAEKKVRPDEPLAANDILIRCQIDIEDNLNEQTGTIKLTHKSGESVIEEYSFPLQDAYNSSEAGGWVEVIAKGVAAKGEFDLAIEYLPNSENGNEKEVLTIFTDMPYESLETKE